MEICQVCLKVNKNPNCNICPDGPPKKDIITNIFYTMFEFIFRMARDGFTGSINIMYAEQLLYRKFGNTYYTNMLLEKLPDIDFIVQDFKIRQQKHKKNRV